MNAVKQKSSVHSRKRETRSSRSKLLSFLSEASELEHGLACSYLYAAFSLKQELPEGGVTWQQLQKIRKWASQIYFIAAQEMLHLAQVWNLQAAIGGTPYYLRPNFPQPSNYYPLGLELTLAPFSENTLRLFLNFEEPREFDADRRAGFAGRKRMSDVEYRTVGDLYTLIAEIIDDLPEDELFIGNSARQVDQELADFPELIRVKDRASAHAAIEMIVEQGEGTRTDRDDSHFGIFYEILEEFLVEDDDGFRPVRNVVANPTAKPRADTLSRGAVLIEHNYSQKVARLFDAVYVLMLRMLEYLFGHAECDPKVLGLMAHGAIRAMPTVVKPLGEALTLLPATEDDGPDGRRAGPAFGMTRHVPLPPDPGLSLRLVIERLEEVRRWAAALAEHEMAPAQLRNATDRLDDLAAFLSG